MKKELLKKILDARTTISQFYGKEFDYFHYPFKRFSIQDGEIIQSNGKNLLVPIEELKRDMDALKQEIKERIQKKEEAQEFLKSGFCCNHSVTYLHYDHDHPREKCLLCGQDYLPASKNRISTIHDVFEIESNPKKAVFLEKYVYDLVPFAPVDIEDDPAYTEDEVMSILQNMVDDLPDGEFDLVDEIEKRNYAYCNIIKPTSKRFILVLAGSNGEYLDDDTYVKGNSIVNPKKLIDYFTDLYNVCIQLVCDYGTSGYYDFPVEEPGKLFIKNYSSLKDFQETINSLKKIPFSLVIDATNLKEVKFKNHCVYSKPYHLNIPTLFPNAEVISARDYLNGNRLMDSYALKELSKDSLQRIRKKMN
ncbi:MAG: hypothetical protein IJ704_04715 [Bacilli bacterium]|nr:hypothetical protein [Bacilli bacterium]